MARSGAHRLSPVARQAALDDATDVGRALGLTVEDPIVLSDNLNLIVHLRPAPVVARIAVRTAPVRSLEALGGSLALASFLASNGLPVAAPAAGLDPGPHLGRRSRLPMTLWQLLEDADPGQPPDPAWAGRSLRAIHATATTFPGTLGHVGPLHEVDRLAGVIATARPADAAWIREILARIEVPAGPVQPVHGDAHLGNVLVARSGPVWIDWEESWRGPVAWDLACLDHRRVVFGDLAAEIGAALDAYGPFERRAVDAWGPVVSLWALAWGTVGAVELGDDLSDNAKVRRRDLERRFGLRAPA